MSFINVVRLAAALVVASTASQAATFTFNTDPFAGSTALQTPGRQFVGNELFIPQFDITTDVIAVNAGVFGISPVVNFFNGFTTNLPSGGRNFIVQQDVDGDPLTAGNQFNAGLAADAIANAVTQAGPGFFVYFNTTLGLNRLVYSTDLDSANADLKIIARFTGATFQDAIDNLPLFTAANFTTAVPEPASIGLLLAGLAGIALRRRAKAAA